MLYFKYLHYDLDNPDNPANDRVIFSKGHASALFYSLYAAALRPPAGGSGQAGKLTEKELMGYRTLESPLEGHPTGRFLFTEAATGSLGQGLSVGVGEAWGLRFIAAEIARVGALVGETFFASPSSPGAISPSVQTDKGVTLLEKAHLPAPLTMIPRVFVLLGDGELAEGSVWEAANWAAFHKLDNLIAVCDINRFGQAEATMWQHNLEVYQRRFEAFGWATIMIDGHDFAQIGAAYEKARIHRGTPVAILAKTVKGKGIAYWEDKEGWHNKMLPKEELEKALAEFGSIDKTIRGIIQKPIIETIGGGASLGSSLSTPEVEELPPKAARDTSGVILTSYDPAIPIPTKKAFGNALERLGEVYPNLIVLDGDVSNSTHTDQFAKKYADRFLQMYIAEQNMVGVATGLARRGFKPFVTTFACFLTRAHDQIRMAPLSGVTIYFNGAYAGVSMGKDGPSQMGLEDMALFRPIIGSTVLYPADPYQTERLVEEMLKIQGVVYIRTTREPTPVIYTKDDMFPIGGSKVHYSSREESLPDRQAGSTNREVSQNSSQLSASNNNELVTVVAAGITLHEALKAQIQLAQENIHIRVIDCYSVKPIDSETLKKAAAETKAIIVVEDHYPEGGLGEAVQSALFDSGNPLDSRNLTLIHLAVSKMPRSGKPEELLAFEGIDAHAIIDSVHTYLRQGTS